MEEEVCRKGRRRCTGRGEVYSKGRRCIVRGGGV